jgi:DNA-directed RNA polymerase subunit omega
MKENTENIDSKFRFILIAAKRARQLQAGAKPMIHTSSRKPTRTAMEETRAGLVKFELIPYLKREDRLKQQEPKAEKHRATTES